MDIAVRISMAFLHMKYQRHSRGIMIHAFAAKAGSMICIITSKQRRFKLSVQTLGRILYDLYDDSIIFKTHSNYILFT